MQKLFLFLFLFFSFTYSQINLHLECKDHIYYLRPVEGDTSSPALGIDSLIIGNTYNVTITGSGGPTFSRQFPGVICSYYNNNEFVYRLLRPDSSLTFTAGASWIYFFVIDTHIGSDVWGSYDILINQTTNLDKKPQNTPNLFKLEQNYPNPFNPNTVIKYNIGRRGHVNLIIFDKLGRKVKTLVNADQLPSNYEVRWDGTDDIGKKVASGHYYYKLIFNNTQIVKKMIFVK